MTLSEIVFVLRKHDFLGMTDWYADPMRNRVYVPNSNFEFGRCMVEPVAEAFLATEPKPSTEPTLDECLAAIRRNKHRGVEKWRLSLDGTYTTDRFNEDEIRIIGKHYIDRERAEKA